MFLSRFIYKIHYNPYFSEGFMGCFGGVSRNEELKRKGRKGKPKMVALNNVRNEVLASAFVVIKRGTP